MSKCPQVEIQKLKERLEVAAYVATDRQVYIAELEAEIAKLQAVVDAAKPLLVLQLTDGIERYEAEQALEQAIKEVK